jgi:hypothetical protein
LIPSYRFPNALHPELAEVRARNNPANSVIIHGFNIRHAMMEGKTPQAVAPIEVPGTDDSGANDIISNVTRNAEDAIVAGNEKTEAPVSEDDHVYPPLRKIISLGVALAMIILLVGGMSLCPEASHKSTEQLWQLQRL